MAPTWITRKSAVNNSPVSHDTNAQNSIAEKQHQGRSGKILGHGLLAVLPMTVFAIVILVLTISFGLRIKSIGGYSSGSYFFMHRAQADGVKLIVLLSALFCILLIPVLLRMSTYLHAKGLSRDSEHWHKDGVTIDPSVPLLLRVLHGSPVAYGESVRRSLRNPKTGRPQIRKAVAVSTILLILSLLIVLPAMCLQFTAIALPENAVSSALTGNFGRALAPDCFSTDSTMPMPMAPTSNATGCEGRVDLLTGNHQEADATAQNQSTLNKIERLNFPGLTDFHGAALFVMADTTTDPVSTFNAETIGVSSWFMNIGANCSLDATNGSYNCPDHHFTGSTQGGVVIPSPAVMVQEANKLKWVLAAKVFAPNGTFNKFANSPNYSVTDNGGTLLTVFHCETAVYDVEYNKTSDERYVPTSVEPMSDASARLVFSPAFPGMIPNYAGFRLDLMDTLFTKSAIVAKTEADISTSWAEGFAFLDTASSADILVPMPAKDDSPTLIAVAKAPVLLICVADFLYAVLGLLLVVVAMRSSREARDMQHRMSVTGLAN